MPPKRDVLFVVDGLVLLHPVYSSSKLYIQGMSIFSVNQTKTRIRNYDHRNEINNDKINHGLVAEKNKERIAVRLLQ